MVAERGFHRTSLETQRAKRDADIAAILEFLHAGQAMNYRGFSVAGNRSGPDTKRTQAEYHEHEINQRIHMNATTMKAKGNWNIAKGELKKRWAALTHDDLTYEEGSTDQLIGRIEKRTGEKREEIERFLKQLGY